ncbi:membrane protein [Lysobacter xinjiangensis]|uniref:Membrane protein n=1 Tax=Cognatilysobacter xinjiangensis TaxID=546892 RepID=A0ABQ3C1X0_9GAMM|nr:membrane protein [Lysobacter xinjiangensis]
MIATRSRNALVATASAVALLGVWLLWRFDPNAPGNPFLPCLFRMATGLYCPGCGLTRMLHALVHGDIARAASMNVLALAGLPVLGAIALNEMRGRTLLRGAVARFAYNGRFWMVAALAFGIARNLPFAPFTALAPG